MKTIFCALIFIPVNSFASAHDTGCQDLENAQLRLKVHTENIVHAAATRTPQGGHYKKKEVVCKRNNCKEKISNEIRTVYEPGHPDANRRGYVKYADIDVKQEYSAVTVAAGEIKALAYSGACLAKLTELKETLIVRYAKGNVLSDIFKFGKHNEIVSWARTFVNGKRQIFDFTARVDCQKFATHQFSL